MTEHADLGFTAMGAAEDSYPSSYLDTSLFHFGFPASEQAFSCAGLPSLFSSDTPSTYCADDDPLMLFTSAGSSAPSESSASMSPPTLQASISSSAWEDKAQLSPDTSSSSTSKHTEDTLSLPTELEYRLYELSQANLSRAASEASSSGNISTPGCADIAINPYSTYPDSGVTVELATGDSFWTAVVHRDPRAVNVFWYGVTSTKIYCRPTCPSRRPMRINIIFFTSCQQAEDAGYRPCKRCTPDEAFETSVVRQATSTFKAAAFIEASIKAGKKSPTLIQLAEAAGMSPFYLQRTFKKHYGVSPKVYANRLLQKTTKRSVPAFKATS